MSIKLQDAINSAKSFASLVPIAKQLEAKISFLGRQYVVIEPKKGEKPLPYEGEVSVGSLVDRTQQIIKELGYNRSNYPERDEAALLDEQINRFYDTDNKNLKESNIFTRIAVIFRNLFSKIFNRNYLNHQLRWAGDEDCSMIGMQRHVLKPLVEKPVVQ